MTASRTLERGAPAAAWPSTPGLAAGDLPATVVRSAGTVAAAALAGAGVVLALRRLAGAIEPAGPGLLITAVAAGLPLVVAADAARRAGGPLGAPLAARCGFLLAAAALALPPRATSVADWAAIAVALLVAAAVVVRVPRSAAGDRPTPRLPATADRPRGPRRVRPVQPAARPGFLRQRFERRELPTGVEHVRGRIVVAVPTGAKAAYGHVGFCPAFTTTPTVEVTTSYDGVEATVTAAEVLPWGVRVECRLAEPAEEPIDIPVDLVASADAPAP